jgi:hypothetical protein
MRLASSLPSRTPQHRSTVNDFNFDSVASRARQKRFCKLIIDKKDVTINSTGSEAASKKGWVAWAPIFWEHLILERDAYESLHERSLVDPHGFWVRRPMRSIGISGGGLFFLSTTTDHHCGSRVVDEVIILVRAVMGAVISLSRAVVAPRLPKTRSKMILRRTIAKISNGQGYAVPVTIEDEGLISDIVNRIAAVGYRTQPREVHLPLLNTSEGDAPRKKRSSYQQPLR